MSVTVLTSFVEAQVAGALVLARSLKARHPDWRVCGVCADRAAGVEHWRADFDRVIDAAELFGDGWRAFAFKHAAADVAAAVRGRALAAALADGSETVICFAPDLAVFGDLSEIQRRLETASILLTPHQAEPNEGARAVADNELRALGGGVYSLNFLAGHDDAGDGGFGDQRHFDLVPALFDGVEVWRDPGMQAASWNLSRREIVIGQDGRILVNGAFPLKTYDFSNPYGDAGIMTERYAGRRLAVYELQAWYKRACAASAPPVRNGEWAYERFEDGAAIAGAARRLYRLDPDLTARFPDPFAAGPDSYHAWLKANRPDVL